jgi:hypothetical protein
MYMQNVTQAAHPLHVDLLYVVGPNAYLDSSISVWSLLLQPQDAELMQSWSSLT